jgi:hypothetical protein
MSANKILEEIETVTPNSARTFRPVRAGGNIGDADDSAQEVDRVEVLTDVAALTARFTRARSASWFTV